ncbi:MAG: hypothetical protein GY822_26805 [Deltaproteobacteria bacterium]|nr:hypothetical protein [Deltaproteobacteria bacterium]
MGVRGVQRWVLLILVSWMAGCAAPPAEVVGTFSGHPFSIEDQSPDVHFGRRTGSVLLVFSEINKDRLRTLTLSVPGALRLKEDVAYPLEDGENGQISLEVSEGQLVVERDKEGKAFSTSVQTEFGLSVDGHVVFAALGARIAGAFEAELDSGDTIRGSFDIELEEEDIENPFR